MTIKRSGSAAWRGGIKDGKGTMSTESGALQANPYGFTIVDGRLVTARTRPRPRQRRSNC